MSRWGWLALAAAVIALAAYAFWPRAAVGGMVGLVAGPLPREFTVRAGGIEQDVDWGSVWIGELQRPLDPRRVERLATALDAVAVPSDRVIDPVAETELAAYGIDGSREIAWSGRVLRWGRAGGLAYVWDGRRVFAAPTRLADELDAVAGRLDDPTLLPNLGNAVALEIGGMRIERGADGRWRDRDRAERPTMTARAGRLLRLLQSLRLERLDGAAPEGAPSLALGIELGGGVRHRLAIHRGTGGGPSTAVIDDLPAQPLDAGRSAELEHAAAALARDGLIDADPAAALTVTSRLEVTLAGERWFTCERRQEVYLPGETDWELAWSGGRETADEGAIATVLRTLCALDVERALPGPDPAPPSPLARRYRVLGQEGSVSELVVDGERAWTPWHHGRLSEPTRLALLQPADLLDLRLVASPPERVVKLQRRADEPALREVLARGDDGAWTRTHPQRAPVDAVAVARLARALTTARALGARLLGDEDRAALAKPALELDLRLAPRSAGAPSIEIADERDTVPLDVGFAFYRDAAGAWRAIDKDGGVSYAVEESLVELARAPLEADVALPVLPGSVVRIEIAARGTRFALQRGAAGGWTLHSETPSAPPAAAEPTEVLRWLRTLSGLRARARTPDASPLLPVQAFAAITVVQPAAGGGEERLTLALAEPVGGEAEASVDSTRAGTPLPRGRFRIDAGEALALAAAAERFASAPAPR